MTFFSFFNPFVSCLEDEDSPDVYNFDVLEFWSLKNLLYVGIIAQTLGEANMFIESSEVTKEFILTAEFKEAGTCSE